MKWQISIKYRIVNLWQLKLHFQIPCHNGPRSKFFGKKPPYHWVTETKKGNGKEGKENIIFNG